MISLRQASAALRPFPLPATGSYGARLLPTSCVSPASFRAWRTLADLRLTLKEV